jgi:hypothetical protein
MSANGNDVLEFKITYRVSKQVRKGFLYLNSETEETKILNDGKIELIYDDDGEI